MTKIISFVSHAKRSGKTAAIFNIGYTLRQLGYRVLLVDTDIKGGLTLAAGQSVARGNGLYHVLQGRHVARDIIQEAWGMDLLPASSAYTHSDLEYVMALMPQLLLKDKLKDMAEDYDFVLIDTPSGFNQLTVAAAVASDLVLHPVRGEHYAREYADDFLRMLDGFRQEAGFQGAAHGVYLTSYQECRPLHQIVARDLEEHFGADYCPAYITLSGAVNAAQMRGVPLSEYISDRTDKRVLRGYQAIAGWLAARCCAEDLLTAPGLFQSLEERMN
jgi:chromosome partitioning protein